MVLFFEKHEASPSGKAAGFDPAIQRFESFRLRKTETWPSPSLRRMVVRQVDRFNLFKRFDLFFIFWYFSSFIFSIESRISPSSKVSFSVKASRRSPSMNSLVKQSKDRFDHELTRWSTDSGLHDSHNDAWKGWFLARTGFCARLGASFPEAVCFDLFVWYHNSQGVYLLYRINLSFEIGYMIALKSYRRLRHGDGERLLERNNKPEREKSPTKIAIVSLTRFIKLPQVSVSLHSRR